MKPIKSLIIFAIVATSGLAAAQPAYYYGPPRDPQGFHRRAGHLAWGFSFGLGFMHDNGSTIACTACDQQPITGMLEGHLGGMLSNRAALLFEIQGNAQQISGFDPTGANNDLTLRQLLVMGALQYWITPQFWIKGGLGAANLDVIDSYGYVYPVSNTGLGVLLGAGFELFSARRFAIDLQGRFTEGIYHYTDGTENVTSGTIGLGFNWY